MFVVVGVEK